jgi:putative sugar O-methyltransferase
MNILNIIPKVNRHAYSLYVSLFTNKDDKALFASVNKKAVALYQEHHLKYDYQEYLMPSWEKNTQEIEDIFIKGFPFSFLRNQMLKHTMFAHLPKQATQIQKKMIALHDEHAMVSGALHEHNTGNPILNDLEYKTSGNSIHHLFHLLKFEKETNTPLASMKSVLEFGGGYGNMAKLFKKMHPDTTYTIIDIPIFSYIQYVYLQTVLGAENVVLFENEQRIVPGKVNIVPMHKPYLTQVAAELTDLDLFISTWALSETNKATQDMVRGYKYFNATNLLLAYQKANEMFEYAQNIEKLPDDYTSTYQALTEYMENNFYLFATKKN